MQSTKIFWKKFIKYLFLGICIMFLLAGVTQSNITSGFALAQVGECGQDPCPQEPAPPAPGCPPGTSDWQFKDSTTVCGQTVGGGVSGQVCNFEVDTCTGETRAKAGSCRVEPGLCDAPPAQPAAPEQPAAPAAPQVCEKKDVIGTVQDCVGDQMCTFNIWQGPKEDGSCQTGRGGAFDCQTSAQCGAVTPTVASPAPEPQAAAAQTCFVCDSTGEPDGQGRWRTTPECPANPPTCQANNSATFGGCIGAADRAVCETRQPQAVAVIVSPLPSPSPRVEVVVVPAQQQRPQGNVINNIENRNTNTQTQSVNVTQAGTGGVVSAARTVPAVVSVAGAPVTTLPKTGLPALAWVTAAFLPLGLRMKRFSKDNHQSNGDNLNYLVENREFLKHNS